MLEPYKVFSERDLLPDRRNGEEDARRGVPPPGASSLSPYETMLVQKVRADLTEFVEGLKMQVARIERERADKHQELQSFPRRQALLNEELSKDSEYAERTFGEGSHAYSEAKDAMEAARVRLDHIKNFEQQRPLKVYLGQFWYVVILIILAGIEMPVNFIAINSIFPEDSHLAGVAMAVAFGATLVFLSHLFGLLMRQMQVRSRNRKQPDEPAPMFWATLGTIGFAAMGLIAVAVALRWEYVEKTGEGSSAAGVLLFFFLNLGIFLVGALLSRLRHDPNPDYQKAESDFNKARKAFEKMQARLTLEMRGLNDDYSLRLSALGREHVHLERDIGKLGLDMDAAAGQRRQVVLRVLEVLGQRLTAYQEYNLKNRLPLPQPNHFGPDGIRIVIERLRKEFEA